MGVGAKSLDRDRGDVHTWPHCHYLMRQCNGVSGWGKVQLKYKLCRCRCEINDLRREETGTSILFIHAGPLALLTPIQLPHPLGPFLPALLTLFRLDLYLPEIASDVSNHASRS